MVSVAALFPGFASQHIQTDETDIHVLVGGQGVPVLLLHGYPQTGVCWQKLAPALSDLYTVIIPDLRGYGDSGIPASAHDHSTYSKRAMANDQIAVMRQLGFERFAIVGHDRGGRVAYRLALDHPERVAKLAVLDIIPTLETWERMDWRAGLSTYHWFFLAQPDGFPEAMIGDDPERYLRYMMRSWSAQPDAFTDEAMAEYIRCFRRPETIHATCEDYRAGATIDVALDAADRAAGRTIACPLLALWGARHEWDKQRDHLGVWRAWASDVRGEGIPCGHFLPEEAPEATLAALQRFLADS